MKSRLLLATSVGIAVSVVGVNDVAGHTQLNRWSSMVSRWTPVTARIPNTTEGISHWEVEET